MKKFHYRFRAKKTEDSIYRSRKLVWQKQHELRAAIEKLYAITHEDFISWAPSIPESSLRNAILSSSRHQLMIDLKVGGVGIEVGTQYGGFAKFMLDNLDISTLSVIDLDLAQIPSSLFQGESRIKFLEGESSDCLETFDKDSVNFIYIDASHAYEYVKKDLEVSATLIKKNGYIICNDYTVWSPAEVEPYGVLKAVNEFMESNYKDFEIAGIGLHGQGYHDIAIRRID